jgi:hypothetical protein
MIHPKIDVDGFVRLVREAPLIAFQRVQFGYAVAAPGEAYYAPINHPGGGNLGEEFINLLGKCFIWRMSAPALRTLRPTAKPTPTVAIDIDKISGDDQAVIDFQTSVVIQAIEEYGRPDLQATMSELKLGMMSEALDLVINHAESARELCDVSTPPAPQIRMHLMQSVQAMKTALEMMLKP